MGNSLQDQLLKAGAISKQQAQKAQSKRRKEKKQQQHGTAIDNKSKILAKQAQAEKIKRDQVLNRQKQDAIESKAINAQIQQLIKLNLIKNDDAETPYNFVEGTQVRNLLVTDDVHSQLSKGILSIVKFKNGYAIVPAQVANKIAERDESILVVHGKEEKSIHENDPYADFEVPDDLIW